MQITWNYKDTELSYPISFEKKVDIFYHRVLGWQLHIADLIANGGQPLGEVDSIGPLRHSGFAVLAICLSYFETIGGYEQRSPQTKTSTGYFKEGVRSVLPKLHASYGNVVGELLARLYEGARNGMYHNSMTVPGVGLGQPADGEPIAYDPVSKTLAISPERLPKTLKRHLEEFYAKLLDSKNRVLRQNFERRFDEHNGISRSNGNAGPTVKKSLP